MKDKQLNSVRIFVTNWQNEKRFDKILDVLDKYKSGVGDIAFFTSDTHAPLKIEEMQEITDIIEKRMEKARKRGFNAGINILATIGHHCEDMENAFSGDYYRMTGADGSVCMGSFCMNDKRYIDDYVVPVYTMLAKANPDFIWIDDDVRYGHRPMNGQGCFCDNCIRIFNETNGTDFTRETLARQLDSGDIDLRTRFLKKNSDAIANLLGVIGKTVRSVNDKITLGFMTGDRFFEGFAFDKFANALSENGKYEIMWRPGGGAYDDKSFDYIMEKVDCIGRQCAYLPRYVTKMHSEIESFPYDLITKSPHSTAIEVLLYVAAGCTGAALNILPSGFGDGELSEPIESIEKYIKKIAESYEFEKILQEKLHGTKMCGLHTGWNQNSQAITTGEYWSQTSPWDDVGDFASELCANGLPQCYNINDADIVLLNEKAAAVMSDDEIKDILSRGVYMNSVALDYINSRGFGDLTGFKAGKEHPVDAHERYLENRFNSGFEGGKRNCRQAFYPGESVSIIPTDENSVIVSDMVDYRDNKMADCCLGVFENSLGGRVCVGGYYPFKKVSFYSKSIQLKRIMSYLSNNSLVAYVKSHARTRIWTYRGKENSYAVLLNFTNDTQENIGLALNINVKAVKVYDRINGGRFDEIPVLEQDGEKIIKIEKLLPYDMILIEM